MNIDYAAKKSQGKAYALNQIGLNLGVLIGSGIYISLIKYFNLSSDYNVIFSLAALIILIFSVVTPFMIIEPPDL